MTTVGIQILEHGQGLKLPEYETSHSAGMDLMAAVAEGEEIVLKPGDRQLIPTGFAMALPGDFEAQVRPRSGLAWKNGVTVLNSPGTIDADYRGEVKVILVNHGREDFVITRGMRIAQMVIAPVTQIGWDQRDSLDDTARGSGGFGSTGVST
ncbi:dUTP diphosphatase [Emcibacter sp.]|uniref:dUTP diphosphatase n=1 Tax=Emcibacter sp. TaxID=1979954 RepID=UPI002AA775AE|nr:dUTP diphosphatase [Emcibacter sp.]